MTKSSAFQSALVELKWMAGSELPILHCPITRERIAAGYDPASCEFPAGYQPPDWSQVPTVLFHYTPEAGEFDYIVPALQSAIDEKRKELLAAAPEDEVDDVKALSDFEILQDHVESLGEVPLVFCVTTRSVAGGPINASVYVGLDLGAAVPR